MIYNKGFLISLCSWLSFILHLNPGLRILKCSLTLVRIISPIRPTILHFTLLACHVNIPFNELIEFFYPFVDSIAQWLTKPCSIHMFREFHHPTFNSKPKPQWTLRTSLKSQKNKAKLYRESPLWVIGWLEPILKRLVCGYLGLFLLLITSK